MNLFDNKSVLFLFKSIIAANLTRSREANPPTNSWTWRASYSADSSALLRTSQTLPFSSFKQDNAAFQVFYFRNFLSFQNQLNFKKSLFVIRILEDWQIFLVCPQGSSNLSFSTSLRVRKFLIEMKFQNQREKAFSQTKPLQFPFFRSVCPDRNPLPLSVSMFESMARLSKLDKLAVLKREGERFQSKKFWWAIQTIKRASFWCRKTQNDHVWSRWVQHDSPAAA